MHTTLDLSKYDALTAYDSRPRKPMVRVDYLPTPRDVASRVREAVDEEGLDMAQVAGRARVGTDVVRSLYERGLAALDETRRVYAVLGIRVHSYPREMVAWSL